MKNLIAAIFIFFSFLTFAQDRDVVDGGVGGESGGSKQSWSDIMKNPNLRPQFPYYQIEEKSIRFDHLCLVGERIRSKYKQPIFKPGSTYYIYDYLFSERITLREECSVFDGMECREYTEVPYEIPLKDKIQVYKRQAPSYTWEPAFQKEFELIECETWKL